MSKIAVVGCEASGKTVFMTALADYYTPGQRPGQQCCLVPENAEANLFAEHHIRRLRRLRRWPQATNLVQPQLLKWSLRQGTETVAEIETLEFDGELLRLAFRESAAGEEVERREACERLMSFLTEADFVVVLLSLRDLVREWHPSEGEAEDEETFALDAEAKWVTRGLLNFVAQAQRQRTAGVLLALTQADRYQQELAEAGGAHELFQRCWPRVAALHPELPIVAFASVDKTTQDNRPAAGFSTAGVLEVMQAYLRQTVGDFQALEETLRQSVAALRAMPSVQSPADFATRLNAFTHAYETLRTKTAMVSERYQELWTQCEALREECLRFAKRVAAVERRSVEEQAQAALWKEIGEAFPALGVTVSRFYHYYQRKLEQAQAEAARQRAAAEARERQRQREAEEAARRACEAAEQARREAEAAEQRRQREAEERERQRQREAEARARRAQEEAEATARRERALAAEREANRLARERAQIEAQKQQAEAEARMAETRVKTRQFVICCLFLGGLALGSAVLALNRWRENRAAVLAHERALAGLEAQRAKEEAERKARVAKEEAERQLQVTLAEQKAREAEAQLQQQQEAARRAEAELQRQRAAEQAAEWQRQWEAKEAERAEARQREAEERQRQREAEEAAREAAQRQQAEERQRQREAEAAAQARDYEKQEALLAELRVALAEEQAEKMGEVLAQLAFHTATLTAAQKREVDQAKQMQQLLTHARTGDSKAMCDLGFAYEKGNGVRIDSAAALRWYRAAGEAGSGEALYRLGFLHYEGELGLEKNPARALDYFKQAKANHCKQTNVDRWIEACERKADKESLWDFLLR